MDLKTFLLARIEEDEAVAREAIEDDGGSDKGFSGQYDRMVQPPSGIGFAQGGFGGPAARMIATFAVPARVLAECAAKRAIIEAHERDDNFEDDRCATCVYWPNCDFDGPPALTFPCPTLDALTTVYSDHPDYRQEWAR